MLDAAAFDAAHDGFGCSLESQESAFVHFVLFLSIPSPSAHATPQRPPESMGDAAKKHAHLTPEELAEFREIFNLVDLDKVR